MRSVITNTCPSACLSIPFAQRPMPPPRACPVPCAQTPTFPPFPAPCTQALLQGHCTQLTLAYCAPNPYSFEGMQGVLEQIAETLPGLNVKTEVCALKGGHGSTKQYQAVHIGADR